MSIISSFKGITIKMKYPEKKESTLPHVIAEFETYKCKANLEGKIISGKFPQAKSKDLEKWITNYTKEIRENWRRMEQGRKLKYIYLRKLPAIHSKGEDNGEDNSCASPFHE